MGKMMNDVCIGWLKQTCGSMYQAFCGCLVVVAKQATDRRLGGTG